MIYSQIKQQIQYYSRPEIVYFSNTIYILYIKQQGNRIDTNMKKFNTKLEELDAEQNLGSNLLEGLTYQNRQLNENTGYHIVIIIQTNNGMLEQQINKLYQIQLYFLMVRKQQQWLKIIQEYYQQQQQKINFLPLVVLKMVNKQIQEYNQMNVNKIVQNVVKIYNVQCFKMDIYQIQQIINAYYNVQIIVKYVQIQIIVRMLKWLQRIEAFCVQQQNPNYLKLNLNYENPGKQRMIVVDDEILVIYLININQPYQFKILKLSLQGTIIQQQIINKIDKQIFDYDIKKGLADDTTFIISLKMKMTDNISCKLKSEYTQVVRSNIKMKNL